jgi:quaternary ammonium compound-resistance protein SugE
VHWLYLVLAIIFEIGFVLGTSAAKGFTRLWPSVLTIASASAGVFFLSLSLRTLDVGVGYTIWVGVGSIGTVALGALFFREKLTIARAACFAAIILGVVGLQGVSGV